VRAKLYALSVSHPAHAALRMVELKGVEHEIVYLLPGFHPLLVRLAGFRGGTVPAMKLNGRRVQGSRAISRFLDEIQPEPPLFPIDPAEREAVEEAERWGEEELQAIARRIFRWALSNRQDLRRWLAEEVVGIPAPGLVARVNAPVARRFARASHATDAAVRSDIANLPTTLDRVAGLIAAGTIGGDQPNAADFQIASSVRLLMAFEDLRPAVEGREAGQLAMRLFPNYPGPIPPALPTEWLAPLTAARPAV
jgi:glutathione S-transferase